MNLSGEREAKADWKTNYLSVLSTYLSVPLTIGLIMISCDLLVEPRGIEPLTS